VSAGLRRPLGAPALAAATVVTWLAWLGWDTGKDLDPFTGRETGPYSVGQVAGCVLMLIALLVVAVLGGLPRWTAAATVTVSFTAAWAAGAAVHADDGLFLIGAVLLAIGMSAGTAFVVLVTDGLRRFRRAPAPPH
jgi:hypothetical protein